MDTNMDINLGSSIVKLTRKSHQKVRTGCSICKTRKIKCDEQKPQCGRCQIYGATCDILDAQSAHSCQKIVGNLRRSVRAEVGALNMLDLELMVHWDASTHATFSPNPKIHYFFRRNAVTVALRCDFVAFSVLSLSAMHLAHLVPARGPELVERGLKYHNLAARKAIELLPIPEEQGNGEMIENLFTFSVFTVFHAISCSERISELFLGRIIPDGSPDWMSLFLGAMHLALVSSSVNNRASIIDPLVQYPKDLVSLREHLEYDTFLPILRAKLDTLTDVELPPDLRAAYSRAMAELDGIMAVLHERPDTRDTMHAFIWLQMTLTDYMPVLRGPSPPQEALVIFCYYCMVLEQLPERWWMGGWAERLRQQTYEILDDEHKSWIVPTTY